MSSPHRLIAFLRDCSEADSRSSATSDLLDDRVRRLQVPLLGWDFVTGRVDRVPLLREDALAAAREAALLGPPEPDPRPTPRPPRPRVLATLSAAQRQVLAAAATRAWSCAGFRATGTGAG